jgi:hypothetical protein
MRYVMRWLAVADAGPCRCYYTEIDREMWSNHHDIQGNEEAEPDVCVELLAQSGT